MPQDQQGFSQIILILLLFVGIFLGVYLVKHNTNGVPKALLGPHEGQVSFSLKSDEINDSNTAGLASGRTIPVKLLVRADSAASNLFVAKIKFPASLLEIVQLQLDGYPINIPSQEPYKKCRADADCDANFHCQLNNPQNPACPDNNPDCNNGTGVCVFNHASSAFFIKNWVDKSYNNSSGTISLIGAVPSPGFQTSSDGDDVVMATIYFKVKSVGNFKIGFDDSSAIYRNSDNLNILTAKNDLVVNVSGNATKIKGDGNGDGRIDLIDLSILNSNLSQSAKDHPELDFNNDGVIDSFDQQVLISLLRESGTLPVDR